MALNLVDLGNVREKLSTGRVRVLPRMNRHLNFIILVKVSVVSILGRRVRIDGGVEACRSLSPFSGTIIFQEAPSYNGNRSTQNQKDFTKNI